MVKVKDVVTPWRLRIRNSEAAVPRTDSGFSLLGIVFSRYPRLWALAWKVMPWHLIALAHLSGIAQETERSRKAM